MKQRPLLLFLYIQGFVGNSENSEETSNYVYSGHTACIQAETGFFLFDVILETIFSLKNLHSPCFSQG